MERDPFWEVRRMDILREIAPRQYEEEKRRLYYERMARKNPFSERSLSHKHEAAPEKA